MESTYTTRKNHQIVHSLPSFHSIEPGVVCLCTLSPEVKKNKLFIFGMKKTVSTIPAGLKCETRDSCLDGK